MSKKILSSRLSSSGGRAHSYASSQKSSIANPFHPLPPWSRKKSALRMVIFWKTSRVMYVELERSHPGVWVKKR